jgi:MATE family multidrug resistance protein
MDVLIPPVVASAGLPARRLDAAGHAHVDQRAVMALALPLMANSAVQIVLNLTDMWFVGRISTKALAAVGAVQWLVLVVVFVLGGIGLAVQTIVAQAQGAHHYRRAGDAVWTALWGTLCAAPLFVAAGAARHVLLLPFGFDAQITRLAGDFWFPRVGGAFFGAAVWAMFGFFNGVGRPRATLLVTCLTALANALFNQLFIFRLGWGIAGSGWATTVAQALGLALAVVIFLRPEVRRKYQSHLTWRPRARLLREQLRLGIPMGVLPAADMLGFAIFQMMQVRIGTVAGAATQVVMMLTSIAYLPGFGIALAGTTLVGQSIGAGDTRWASRVGSRVILLAAAYMGGIGVLLALAGPAILPLFTGAHDADAPAAVALGTQLLWIAAGYHFFDGVNLGSVMCLRGAGDAAVPAALVLLMSWLLFVPLAHALTFAPGQGWVEFLPQFGWGAVGGWIAVLIYIMVLGSTLFLRWRSRAWWAISDRNLSKKIL